MDNERRFLEYAAAEPMTVLRKRFNRGEEIYKQAPEEISAGQAAEDARYLRYVLENAYSGYPYHDKELFDKAFGEIQEILNKETYIKTDRFIDVIAEQLSFICDGHLSFTTADYGRGFYKRTATYVADILLEKVDGGYIDAATGEPVDMTGGATAFPTVSPDGKELYLVGIRGKREVHEIGLRIGGSLRMVPVHEIKSREPAEEVLLTEAYADDLAIITCSTFLGDSEQDLEKFKSVGEKCRKYRDVIWDLSNNLGGNSAFAEQFLIGLNGGYHSANRLRSLNSSLVFAKEYGEIREIDYHFTEEEAAVYEGEDLFPGTLHVIINNRVASSAELALIYGESLPKVRFYGCSSLGIGRFGDLCIYYLPHSNITLWCPQKVFQNRIPETEGLQPDYWIDSQDVAAVVTEAILRERQRL